MSPPQKRIDEGGFFLFPKKGKFFLYFNKRISLNLGKEGGRGIRVFSPFLFWLGGCLVPKNILKHKAKNCRKPHTKKPFIKS